MKTLKSSTKTVAYFLASAFVVLAVASLGMAFSGGIDEERAVGGGGSIMVGCTCHNPVPDANVTPILEGVPGVYGEPAEAGGAYESRIYNLTVRIAGGPEGPGGFNLQVSAGTLAAVGEAAQILESGEATHARPNPDRTWNLTWTSPTSANDAVVFRLTVNAVNGDGAPSPDDLWNRLIVASQGAGGAGVGAGADAVHVEGFGVNWLAYWVGIASFVFLGVVLVVYYFVFRYSETSHATDHGARKGKK